MRKKHNIPKGMYINSLKKYSTTLLPLEMLIFNRIRTNLLRLSILFILLISMSCALDDPKARTKDIYIPQAQEKIGEKAQTTASKAEENSKIFEYRIGEADVLYIAVWREEDLSQEVIVRPDGKISFLLAGDVPAAGLTFPQLKEELIQRLKSYIRYPVVSVSLKKLGGRKVIVLGAVNHPGVYSVTGKNTILEAISLAGGFTPDAVASSTIHIEGGLQSPKGRKLNLTRAINGADMSQNVVLEAEDIIYIPRTFIADVSRVLTQILGPISQGVYSSRTLHKW